jgi:Ca-activated chloride channel family protein
VAADTIRLPKTATTAELKMITGLTVLLLSLVLFVFNRRQPLLTDSG